MSFPINYETVMTETANLAMAKEEPGYVRVRALVALVRELSPLNERHLEVKRELNIDEARVVVMIDEEAEALAYMKGIRDAQADYAQCDCPCTCGDEAAEEEQPADEDDDPL